MQLVLPGAREDASLSAVWNFNNSNSNNGDDNNDND